MKKQNNEINEISLGTFTLNIILKENGNYDLWVNDDGSSGLRYPNTPKGDIGKLVTKAIEDVETAILSGIIRENEKTLRDRDEDYSALMQEVTE